MLIVPIITALSSAIGFFSEKLFLIKYKVNRHLYLSVLFLFLFPFSLLFYKLIPGLSIIDQDAFKPYYIFLLILLGIVGLVWNILFVTVFGRDKVSDTEMILMLEPIVTITMASIFFSSERNIHVLVISLIAGSALIFAHIQKHHLSFDHDSKYLLYYLLLVGFESVIVKELLEVYSPIPLYAYRTFLIFICLLIAFRPFNKSMGRKTFLPILGLSLIGALSMITMYYSYNLVGIVQTRLILLIAPVLIYAGSVIIFKEQLKWRAVVSSLIIFSSILYLVLKGI